MNAATLIILLLLAGPDDEAAGQALKTALIERGGARVTVLVGVEAAARLKGFDIGRSDLLADPNLGRQLTRQKPDLVLIHLDQREVAVREKEVPKVEGAKEIKEVKDPSDQVVDVQLWFSGMRETFSAIAGKGGDPGPALHRGVISLLQPLLDQNSEDKGGKPAAAADLAQLVRSERWEQVLATLAGLKEKGPRDRYYQVLAYARLKNRDAAVETLNQLRTAHPGHFLVTAAEELIPPAPEEPPAVPKAETPTPATPAKKVGKGQKTPPPEEEPAAKAPGDSRIPPRKVDDNGMPPDAIEVEEH